MYRREVPSSKSMSGIIKACTPWCYWGNLYVQSCMYRNIDTIVHTLEEHIQDSVESAEFTEGSPMYVACERYSEGYKNWALGYEIILCSVLQVCVAHVRELNQHVKCMNTCNILATIARRNSLKCLSSWFGCTHNVMTWSCPLLL